jgi:HPr kinase/phosphorylase
MAEGPVPEAIDPGLPPDGTTLMLHATTVAHGGRALLLTGAPGAGKSSLALALIAQGASLVADDRTLLTADGPSLRAAPPAAIAGLIEARHIGILRLPYASDVPLGLAVDLDTAETDRLPPARQVVYLGRTVALLRRADGPHVVPSLLHCLAQSRVTP